MLLVLVFFLYYLYYLVTTNIILIDFLGSFFFLNSGNFNLFFLGSWSLSPTLVSTTILGLRLNKNTAQNGQYILNIEFS